MKGKKGLTAISVLFSWVVYFILYAMILGKWLTTACQNYIVAGELTGLSAFIIANLPLFANIFVLLAGIIIIYVGEG